ncbi:MerR family transcriptional regulator [Kribbella sp. ALI-6-A]|jgi:DNA-binding transcriptional MerR regulator|uniref:MerR family transcriptional regulator n=1 Tax=Kribbella sp. ALI-6-A TaxID=1933817 RepID=UPI00097C6E44|nr:MerR family transcriptional regulator [Kribbella sp. ALI-6-A]ONI67423.1 MerR family transcriptional regulator [Kribbella sp. ALI-6-A]
MMQEELAEAVTIGEASRVSGLPVETLRYYDREGLFGDLPRDSGGRRRFTPDALGLLDILLRLRRTGMPVEQVREFAEHVRAGDHLRAGRLALLRAHRERVAMDLAQLEADLEVIDWKIAAYQAAEDGNDPPPRD